MNTKPPGRTVLLTHESAAARLLAETIAGAVELAGIVVRWKWEDRLKQNLRSILGERIFVRFHSLFKLLRYGPLERRLREIEGFLKNRAIHELHERFDRPEFKWPYGVPVLQIDNINGSANQEWCRNLNPDLFILFGVPVLREPLLHMPRIGTLNIHTSLLPEYRGPWPEFFQVLNEDYEATGVTIHIAIDQLDCGEIVMQKPSNPGRSMDPYQLRTANVLVANAILPGAVRAFIKGSASPFLQKAPKTSTHRLHHITRAKRRMILQKLGYPL